MNYFGKNYSKELRPIYPSTDVTVWGLPDEAYEGNPTHSFVLRNSTGFENGRANYDDSYQGIQFVQKNEDGSIIPGIQTEQLLRVLIERHQALNNKFPSREGALAITHMQTALLFLQERVAERMDRGVMGQLKK